MLSLSKLEDQIEVLEDALDKIDGQLDGAKADRIVTGNYRSAEWWARAKFARRSKSRRLQRLQAKAGHVRREQRQRQGKILASNFIDAARRRLDQDLFSEIMDEATDELEAA